MIFKHNLLPRVEITDTTTESGRTYHTPAGDFRSVTTIIGAASDHSWLDDWKERVGEQEAAGITRQAGIRGTAVHTLAEKYVMNDPDWKVGAMPINLWAFNQIKPILDKGLDEVLGVEYPLWSKTLNTAGRSDLPCVFQGKPTILDYKTSKRPKAREDIWGYFVQGTVYGLMLEELTGVRIRQIAVLISVDGSEPQLFIENPRDWYARVREIFLAS